MNTHALRSVLLAVTLAACAEEAAAPAPVALQPVPAALPESVPMDQYFSLESAVECAALFRCASSGDSVGLRLLFGTYERCVANPDPLGQVALERARRRQLVAAGTSRYDGAAARRCLEAYRAGLCPERAPDACDLVFTGTVAEGGACRRHDDCSNDRWCQTDDGTGGARCPGVCARRAAVGERCLSGTAMCSQRGARGVVDCAYVPELAGEDAPFRCTDTGVATGAGFAREGEVCADRRGASRVDRPCGPRLDCIPRDTPEGPYGACAGPQPTGQPCVRYCQGDAVCEFDATRFEQRCLPVAVRNREGESCVQGNVGAEVCNVLLGLDCVANRCRRVGTGELDSACFTARFGVDSCRAGLACNVNTQTCRPRAAVGMPCRSANECESRQCVTDGTGAPRCVGDLGCGE